MEDSTPESGYGNKIFTPKNVLIYVVFAVLAYGAVYYLWLGPKGGYAPSNYGSPSSTYSNEASQSPQPEASPSAPAMVSSTVELAEQNKSKEMGQAVLTEAEGKTTVSITLENYPKATPQPAHIHVGACASLGEVKYALNNVVNGKSETTIEASLADLVSQMPLAINVHKSASQATVYVACGDLK